MKPWIVALLVLAAAAAGFAAGRAASVPVETTVPRSELTRVERERDDALARAQRADAALAQERRPRAAAPANRQPFDGATPPGGALESGESTKPAVAPDAASKSEAERQQDVRDLVARIDSAFEHGDGEGALEVLRRLGSIVPEGREPAMNLALRMDEDVKGAGTLRLGVQTFYLSLGDTGVRDLMVWALENPSSPAAFRALSASNLPWVLAPSRQVEVLAAALGRERDPIVVQALVVSLAEMRDAKASAALAAVMEDTSRDGAIRAIVVSYLAATAGNEFSALIESAAEADPDDRVRAAARQAILARNPPVDGFLVMTVVPSGAADAAGMKSGDLLVTYDGKPARELKEIMELTAATGPGDTAPVVVLRESGEVTLQIRRGRMGIQGRPVKRK